jgi:hypothetical protein
MSSLQDTFDALALVPYDFDQLRAVCEALLKDRRDDELLPYTERALAIEPRDLHVVNWRAQALTLLGRHFDAVATWRNYAAHDWKHAYYRMSLGQTRVMSGDVERGVPMLEVAWRTAAADSEWLAAKAELLYSEALLRTARPAGFERWLARNHGDSGDYRADGIPVWSGEQDLRGKRVLVTHWMGFGDQFLLFACLSQWLSARRVLCASRKRYPKNWEPDARVRARSARYALASTDARRAALAVAFAVFPGASARA